MPELGPAARRPPAQCAAVRPAAQASACAASAARARASRYPRQQVPVVHDMKPAGGIVPAQPQRPDRRQPVEKQRQSVAFGHAAIMRDLGPPGRADGVAKPLFGRIAHGPATWPCPVPRTVSGPAGRHLPAPRSSPAGNCAGASLWPYCVRGKSTEEAAQGRVATRKTARFRSRGIPCVSCCP